MKNIPYTLIFCMVILVSCNSNKERDYKEQQNLVTLKNIEANKNEYTYLLLYQGRPIPPDEISSYFELERLDYIVECNTYHQENNFIVELPSKLDFYLLYGLLASVTESSTGQMNCLLVALNERNKELSYYLLYDRKRKFSNGGEYYLGVLNDGQSFTTNVSYIIDSSFVKSSSFLEDNIHELKMEDYLKSINFDLNFFHSYKNLAPIKQIIDKK